MKKILSAALLSYSLAFSGLEAEVVANKTYFSPRSDLHQRGREWSAQDHFNKDQAGRRGMQVAVMPFYSWSTNSGGLNEYFGGSNTDDGSDVGAVEVVRTENDITNALQGRSIDHDTTSNSRAMAGYMQFKPKQTRAGAVLSLSQSLDMFKIDILKDMTISVDAPITQVSNELNPTAVQWRASTVPLSSGGTTLISYFTGLYTKTSGVNQQSKLKSAKVYLGKKKCTELADVRITASYDFVKAKDSGIALTSSVIIPAGNKSTGEFLFGPVAGNNNHVELGVGVNGFAKIWSNKHFALQFGGSLEYMYGFQAREKRTAGVWDRSAGRVSPWAQARLAMKKDVVGAQPLANVSTMDVLVRPGSHFECVLGANLQWHSFSLNLGYNMYLRQKEQVCLIDNSWANDTYAFPALDQALNAASNEGLNFENRNTGGGDPTSGGPIQMHGHTATAIPNRSVSYYLSTEPCTTPDQESHTLLMSLSHSREVKNFPISCSVGGSYELAADQRKAINGWAVFGKFAIGF